MAIQERRGGGVWKHSGRSRGLSSDPGRSCRGPGEDGAIFCASCPVHINNLSITTCTLPLAPVLAVRRCLKAVPCARSPSLFLSIGSAVCVLFSCTLLIYLGHAPTSSPATAPTRRLHSGGPHTPMAVSRSAAMERPLEQRQPDVVARLPSIASQGPGGALTSKRNALSRHDDRLRIYPAC
jgi:hypothetical protein